MAEFPDLIRPTETRDWVGPKQGRVSGLQGAHLIGDDLWRNKLEFLDPLKQFGISAGSISNGSLLPETQRGGAVLGVSVHANFKQVVKDKPIRIHPVVSQLVDPVVLHKMKSSKGSSASGQHLNNENIRD